MIRYRNDAHLRELMGVPPRKTGAACPQLEAVLGQIAAEIAAEDYGSLFVLDGGEEASIPPEVEAFLNGADMEAEEEELEPRIWPEDDTLDRNPHED